MDLSVARHYYFPAVEEAYIMVQNVFHGIFIDERLTSSSGALTVRAVVLMIDAIGSGRFGSFPFLRARRNNFHLPAVKLQQVSVGIVNEMDVDLDIHYQWWDDPIRPTHIRK